MKQFSHIEYDVSSLRNIPDLLQLCMLVSKAYENLANTIWYNDKQTAIKANGLLMVSGPEHYVPLPTHIDFRNLGVFIRIVYFLKKDGLVHYLTHLNVKYDEGMWIVVPGIDDIAECESDTERAVECAVRRLRSCMDGMYSGDQHH